VRQILQTIGVSLLGGLLLTLALSAVWIIVTAGQAEGPFSSVLDSLSTVGPDSIVLVVSVGFGASAYLINKFTGGGF